MRIDDPAFRGSAQNDGGLKPCDIEKLRPIRRSGASVAVLRVALERWVRGPGDQDLSTIIRESLDQLTTLTADG